MSAVSVVPRVALGELARYFLRLGTLGFGGLVALCGLMERELVRERGWVSRQEMRDAIAVSQSLPGAGHGAAGAASLPILGKLFAFFLKAGALTFGSGLVIVPFLEKGLVQDSGWLSAREFLVAGFWGSLVSTIGIFLLVLLVAPLMLRHRANPNVQGFVKGAYGAAIGTILGASILLARIAIGDWLTALVLLGSLGVLFRFKVSNPLLIGSTAAIGLAAFPLPRPAWVFVQ